MKINWFDIGVKAQTTAVATQAPETPVSGSVETTIAILVVGLAVLACGIYLKAKKVA